MDERGVICRFRCIQKLGNYFLIYMYNINFIIKLISLNVLCLWLYSVDHFQSWHCSASMSERYASPPLAWSQRSLYKGGRTHELLQAQCKWGCLLLLQNWWMGTIQGNKLFCLYPLFDKFDPKSFVVWLLEFNFCFELFLIFWWFCMMVDLWMVYRVYSRMQGIVGLLHFH